MVAIDTAPQPKSTAPSEAGEASQPRRSTRRGRWPLALTAVAILIGLSLLSPAGRHQWAISFIRQPSHYTALSLQDAYTLPTTIQEGSPVHLSFTVANHEGRRMGYRYVLSSANLSESSTTTVLHRATLNVPSGGQRTASVTVRPVCAASSCEVQITLPGHPEHLDVVLHVHRSPK
jgi:hypothetical protein